jgi:hypothetical protein
VIRSCGTEGCSTLTIGTRCLACEEREARALPTFARGRPYTSPTRHGAAHADGDADKRDPLTALPLLCLACGALIEKGLTFVGSLRCVECRDKGAPLQPSLVELWHAAGAPF